MTKFTIPREIYFGRGALENLKNLKGKRAIIVTGGSSMKKSGFLNKATDYLKEAGLEVEVFGGVEPDPSVETVIRGAAAMSKFEPDWIVAIGGGSPIDAAKAMWIFYEDPAAKIEDLFKRISFPDLRKKARLVAISSTSGSASEVTYFSVITDHSSGIKYALANPQLAPDIAIVDPDLVDTMPKSLAASTGMDALTHAIEAYVSIGGNAFTDPFALQAIQAIFNYLPDSYEGSAPAREEMHYAQCFAGMAFSNGRLGIVHSIAHKTGAAFDTVHVPHGVANAIYLSYVIAFNAKDPEAKAKYAEMAKLIGCEGRTDDELVESLMNKIREYNKLFCIPNSLREFGIGEIEFTEKVKEIAVNAISDGCTFSNPRQIDSAQMEKLLWCIYEGNEVDF